MQAAKRATASAIEPMWPSFFTVALLSFWL
jgi:hypothetical protein